MLKDCVHKHEQDANLKKNNSLLNYIFMRNETSKLTLLHSTVEFEITKSKYNGGIQ